MDEVKADCDGNGQEVLKEESDKVAVLKRLRVAFDFTTCFAAGASRADEQRQEQLQGHQQDEQVRRAHEHEEVEGPVVEQLEGLSQRVDRVVNVEHIFSDWVDWDQV